MKKLSSRLQCIYDLLIPGEALWDIGCDHGLLGMRGLTEARFSSVNFVEPSVKAMESLKNSFSKQFSEADTVNFLLQKGEDLDWSKVSGNVVIAGMGARTIVKILEAASVQPQKRNFILSPNWSQKLLVDYLKDSPVAELSARDGHRERLILRYQMG
ncbi:MAG: tRNA (adenine(22)-N(1))-methyltransferase TrmK [Bdellovibrionales bacterium]